MDIIIAIGIFFGCLLYVISVCVMCCWVYTSISRRGNQTAIYNNNNSCSPVVVTSSTHTTATAYGQSGGYHEPPYPTTNTSYPMPHPTTIAGGGHINPPYNTAPYPMHTNTGMPMPQSTGYPHPQPGFQTVPYPPPASDPQANPPSYDQVVGNTAPYNKQSAYNPHYSG